MRFEIEKEEKEQKKEFYHQIRFWFCVLMIEKEKIIFIITHTHIMNEIKM